MTVYTRAILLTALLGALVVLAGCPGMPGGGAGAQNAANMPPGMQPPPGLDSGGARTLMGTTIIPPDNSVLLVKYGYADAPSDYTPEWQSCRRIIPIETCLLLEGVN